MVYLSRLYNSNKKKKHVCIYNVCMFLTTGEGDGGTCCHGDEFGHTAGFLGGSQRLRVMLLLIISL